MLTNIAKLELNQVQGYKGTDQLVVFYLLIDSIFMYFLVFLFKLLSEKDCCQTKCCYAAICKDI